MFRVVIEPGPKGTLVVSDDGYATQRVESTARSTAALRDRYSELARIATSLDLEWSDDTFKFSTDSAETAAMRCVVLAQAVDRALTIAQNHPARAQLDRRGRFGAELRQSLRLTVKQRSRVFTETGDTGVTVDFEVKPSITVTGGVIEFLTGRTAQGAAISVDRAVVNFLQLKHAEYQGTLFGVYDDASPAAAAKLLTRFNYAKPEGAILVSSTEAVKEIRERLAA
jgi:hypothetical protein